MWRKSSDWFVFLGVLLAVLVGFGAYKFNLETKKLWTPVTSKELGLECLEDHLNLEYHIHSYLRILVDGVNEPIPANVGITDICMAEVHTHDATGKIHVETVTGEKLISVETFLKLWGKPLRRPGYILTVYLGEKDVTDVVERLNFYNDDDIVLKYESLGSLRDK